MAAIRTGIGGWTFEPWRGHFYPDGLRQADELAYAAARLGTIEINGTYYRTQKPESFAKWRDATPDGFRFAVKASRYAVTRKKLADAGESVARFVGSGLAELGDKLGPLLWELLPTRTFNAEDIAAFFALLPAKVDGIALRHVIEVRHASFACAEFVALARKYGVAIAVVDHAEFPQIADLTADFVYARLMRGSDDVATAYDVAGLDHWAAVAESWASGHAPRGLTYVGPAIGDGVRRDVFAYVIHEGKLNAPAGAMALAERIARR